MNKRQFFLSVVALISLASCSSGASSSSVPSSASQSAEPSSSDVSSESSLPSSSSSSKTSSSQSTIPDSPLTLWNANSRYQASSYNDPKTSKPLATYRHRDYGEVPYIEVSQYLPILQFEGDDAVNAVLGPGASKNGRSTSPLSLEKVADHLYGIYRDNILTTVLDPENDVITLKRYDILAAGLFGANNDVWLDPAEANNGNLSLVHSSTKSKVLDAYKDEVYDLSKYHMDLVEAEGKVYVPFQLFDALALRTLGRSTVYNGVDYYASTYLNSLPIMKASCYSMDNTFLFEDVLHTPSEDLLEGELFRYVAALPESKWADPEVPEYDIFSLRANGGGAVYHATSLDADLPEISNYKIAWELIDDEYYISLAACDKDTGEATGTATTMRVLKKDGYFNTKTRSRTLANFNFDLLRFQFDELYGLKEDLAEKQGYIDFNSFTLSKGIKEKLLSLDSAVYDEGLAEFIMKYVDDGHSSYSSRSIFSGITEKSGADLAKEYTGPRVTNLKALREEYAAMRQEAVGEGNPVGLFMEGETAVIRFDTFTHFFNMILAYEDDGVTDPAAMIPSSTPYAFDMCFNRIKNNEAIKNVVIDLTCNQGGAVLTVPYLAAFFTDDPFMHNREVKMEMDRELHYSVDLNHNGIFGEKEDTYKGQYNFFVLTSDFSFSCGSLLPAMAHDAGVKIIGKQSGGGACTVGNYSDACGTSYNVSSTLQTLYRDSEGKLVHNDAGVPVDYPLAKEVWYDLPKLDTFVSSLVNE